jgi:hypothetical protein
VAALLEACEFCDAPANHGELTNVLVRPEYVGVPESAMRPGIRGEINSGHGRVRVIRDFNIFHQRNANEPSGEKLWPINLSSRRAEHYWPEARGLEPKVFGHRLRTRLDV